MTAVTHLHDRRPGVCQLLYGTGTDGVMIFRISCACTHSLGRIHIQQDVEYVTGGLFYKDFEQREVRTTWL